MADKLFYFLSFLALLCALMVVVTKNPVHSVLYLIITFFCLTGHYVLLNAQFLAVVNLIVYAGAIMVLFLFVIMLLNLNALSEPLRSGMMKLAAAITGGMLLVILVAALKDVDPIPLDPASFDSQIGLVKNLGKVLFSDYLLPFELASILLLAAMVGSILLGKRDAKPAENKS